MSQPFLKLGKRDPAVQNLKERLIRLGFDPGPPGETFDLATDKAVRAFQRKHRLEVDGKVGPLTWAALIAAEHGSTAPVGASPFSAKLADVAVGQQEKFHLRDEGSPARRDR
jgi:peptidoglycan hydrolase-like protein with peptidoglycan-binding domain